MQHERQIEAVVFDWAGTTMDYGCMAPVVAYRGVFAAEGVPISVAEARKPMGAHKREHLRQITEQPEVMRRWREVRGAPPCDADVDRMYERFVPVQLECLAAHALLIEGTIPLVATMRARGIKIGSTTGYTTEMMAINLREAARQGFVPDATVCADEVARARPFPDMCFENAIRLGVSDVHRVVKVDDTLPGVAEGRNAGMWTIGLALSGNEVGLTQEAWRALPEIERTRLRDGAYQRMHGAGADYVVDDIAGVLACIDDIEARLSAHAA